jgi:hypothetical protein
MKFLIAVLFTCAALTSTAQTNFVKNPSFEKYDSCPVHWDQLVNANYWRGVIDSAFIGNAEYYNSCSNYLLSKAQHVPDNSSFYQYPRTGIGMIGAVLYYDKPPPPTNTFTS